MTSDVSPGINPISTGTSVASPMVEQPMGAVPDFLRSVITADLQGLDSIPQNRLVSVRLGIASGVFTSLRVRHQPTADHSLRVALLCSGWALSTQMREDDRHTLEVAALLHDVGKIGVPDAVLRKPSSLTPEQSQLMSESRKHGLQVLSCFVPQSVLDSVAAVGSWFDGTRGLVRASGADLPLASRMITIVDAFDSMSSDTIYRKGMPRDRAIGELFAFAGTQFDPELVSNFAKWNAEGRISLSRRVADSWLASLSDSAADQLWQLRLPQVDCATLLTRKDLFYQELLHGIHDAVMFMDGHGQVLEWSRGATQMTGIVASAVEQRLWLPRLVGLRDASGQSIDDDACPIAAAVMSGRHWKDRMIINGRGGSRMNVDILVLPVRAQGQDAVGATVIFRDATSQANLEQRVIHLHEKATRDPLTNVANRAEFDRFHAESVSRHLAQGYPCSLIICDIDRFKQINDKFGHQAGDQAIVSLASILMSCCRSGDLVARYGGEEFVIVCEECGIAEATELAEKTRLQLSQTPLRELGGQCITASFGVTEVQPGDTPESMLRRADRGLLQAKQNGRNCVIQLGAGLSNSLPPASRGSWWSQWISPSLTKGSSQFVLTTNVPINFAIDKLGGFISDHDAVVVSAEARRICLEISSAATQSQRRQTDRSTPFRVNLVFDERIISKPNTTEEPANTTIITVEVAPLRGRDRRSNPSEHARHIVNSLRSYLMAQELNAPLN
jgi:diguanylate cyclase (GGDEF)-like protein